MYYLKLSYYLNFQNAIAIRIRTTDTQEAIMA